MDAHVNLVSAMVLTAFITILIMGLDWVKHYKEKKVRRYRFGSVESVKFMSNSTRVKSVTEYYRTNHKGCLIVAVQCPGCKTWSTVEDLSSGRTFRCLSINGHTFAACGTVFHVSPFAEYKGILEDQNE